MKNYYTLLVLMLALSCWQFTAAQKPEIGWQYPGREITAAMEAHDGRVAVVGGAGGGFFFGFIDPRTHQLSPVNLEWQENAESIRAITRSYDGCFVLAGHTLATRSTHPNVSETAGAATGRNGLLLKVDPAGKVIWGWLIKNGTDTELTDLVQLPDGDIVAVGQSEGQMFGFRCSREGVARWGDGKRLTDFGTLGGRATAIVHHPNGRLAITGYRGADDRQQAVFQLLDDEGNASGKPVLLKSRTHSQALAGGVKVIADRQGGGFAVAGQAARGATTDDDVFLMQLDTSGNPIWDTLIAERKSDKVATLVQVPNGAFVLAGSSMSYSPFGRKYSGWLVRIDPGRAGTDSYPNEKGKFEDAFQALVPRQNGALWALGYMKNASNAKEGWLYPVSQEPFPAAWASDFPSLLSSRFFCSTPAHKDTLHIGLHEYIAFTLDNRSAAASWDLKAVVEAPWPTWPNEYHEYQDTVFLGQLSGQEQQTFGIPLFGEHQQRSGARPVQIRLIDHRGVTLNTFQVIVQTKSEPMPELEIIGHAWSRPRALPQRSDTLGLTVTIRNIGEADAYVTTRFLYPVKLEFFSKTYQEHDKPLKPGETMQVALRFKARSYYENDTIIIGCEAWGRKEAGREWPSVTSVYEEQGIGIESFFLVKPSNGPPFKPDWAKGRGNKGGANEVEDRQESDWRVQVLSPSEKSSHEYTDDVFLHVHVQLTADIPKALHIGEVELLYDGQMVPARRNMGITFPQLFAMENENGYQFWHVVRLRKDPGMAASSKILELRVQGKTEWKGRLKYRPDIRLNLLIAGVPYKDLKYTTSDAWGINQAYRQIHQFNLFDSISPKLLLEADFAEEAQILQKEFPRFMKNSEDTLRPQDLTIIYLSAHGFVNSNSGHFIVPNPKYTPSNPDYNVLDVSNAIMNNFKRSTGPKIILIIDACYSGSLDVPGTSTAQETGRIITDELITPNEIIRRIALASGSSLSLLASCNSSQLSREDTILKHGVFTKAILDAFANKTVMVENEKGESVEVRADDGDGDLTIGELYVYIHAWMRQWLKNKDYPDRQYPVLSVEPHNYDQPIYYVGPD